MKRVADLYYGIIVEVRARKEYFTREFDTLLDSIGFGSVRSAICQKHSRHLNNLSYLGAVSRASSQLRLSPMRLNWLLISFILIGHGD